MADAQTLRQIAQSRTPFSTWLGVVLLFALFGLIVLAIIGPSPRSDTYEQKRAKDRQEKLKKLREEDAKALTSYGWIDKSKGIARIPIERAMALAVVELARKKPTMAGPIATPAPSPPPAGAAGGATPAAGASPAPSPTPKGAAAGGPAKPQPAAATNPSPAAPATQPGASASPAASAPPVTKPPVSPAPAATP